MIAALICYGILAGAVVLAAWLEPRPELTDRLDQFLFGSSDHPPL